MLRATRLPSWLKVRLTFDEQYRQTSALIRNFNLNTVCHGAGCPNRGACFSEGTATFMILGSVCTRSCGFCGVSKGMVAPPDPEEPLRVALAIAKLALDYVVLTSVTRDDLPDGGAGVFRDVIINIRNLSPQAVIEILTPDFQGDEAALQLVAQAGPDVFNHNLETVPRLYNTVRPEADYRRSLGLLARMKELLPGVKTKSGLMVGLGETAAEVEEVLKDLRAMDCDFLTIGQYLAPSEQHLPVLEYIHPDQFKVYEQLALDLGFKGVAAGPLVRSSYQAKEMYLRARR